jgi:hypothetical protein
MSEMKSLQFVDADPNATVQAGWASARRGVSLSDKDWVARRGNRWQTCRAAPAPVAKAVAKVVATVCGVAGITIGGIVEKLNHAFNISAHPGVIIRVGVKVEAQLSVLHPIKSTPYVNIDPWN